MARAARAVARNCIMAVGGGVTVVFGQERGRVCVCVCVIVELWPFNVGRGVDGLTWNLYSPIDLVFITLFCF